MRGVAVVVENQIRMAILARQPAGNLDTLVCDGVAHGRLGAGPVIPGRRSGDVALALQTLAEFGVGASDVLAQGVASGGFVL